MMPFWAILRHDLRTLWASWLVRLWLVGTAVLTMLLVTSGWQKMPTAPLASVLFFPYLFFPWVLVVMVLGVMPVTGARVEALADGFLSRPVTRYEFLLASWLARVFTVLGVYLAVTVPAILLVALASRPPKEDHVTVFGVLSALAVVGLVQTFVTSLGFLLGTVMGKPFVPLLILVFLWYPFNAILNTYNLEQISPLSLSRSMATLLREPWPGTVAHSSVVEAEVPEEQDSYAARFMKAFSETPPREEQEPARFFDNDEFEDFSLAKVILGYGLPTLASVGLAVLCFCYRDL